MRPTKRSRVGGFTLVELLVVIVILSLLAALSARAVFSAINTAKEAQIKIEMTQLLAQLDKMRQDYGAFPPSAPPVDATDPNDPAVKYIRHMAPLTADPAAELAGFTNTSQALTFWLGGVSPDPTKPMTGGGTPKYDYEFDAARINADGSYRPPIESLSSGYVYTRGSEQKATITHAGLDDVAGGDDALSVGN